MNYLRKSYNINVSDFEKICRFCMKADLFLKPLFNDDCQDDEVDDFASDDGYCQETVTEMIAHCTQMIISPLDKLPKFMCSSCMNELLRCNRFRHQCLESDESLRKILQMHAEKPDDPELVDSEDISEQITSFDDIYDSDKMFDVKIRDLDEIRLRSDRLFTSDGPNSNIESEPNSLGNQKQNADNGQSIGHRPTGSRKKFSRMEEIYEKHKKTDSRKFKCTVCKSRFLSLHDLRNHSRVHSAQRLYRCDECHKRFRTFGFLTNHRKVHARENQEYRCRICGISFLLPVAYRTHMNAHKRKISLGNEHLIIK